MLSFSQKRQSKYAHCTRYQHNINRRHIQRLQILHHLIPRNRFQKITRLQHLLAPPPLVNLRPHIIRRIIPRLGSAYGHRPRREGGEGREVDREVEEDAEAGEGEDVARWEVEAIAFAQARLQQPTKW